MSRTGNRQRSPERRAGSALLHLVDDLAARPLLALCVVAADLVWMLFSAVLGFPDRLDVVFQTLVAALTLAMVFVIQHTQAREQLVVQRKLDEILHALPDADNAVIAIEDASDDELGSAHQTQRRRRHHARSPSHG